MRSLVLLSLLVAVPALAQDENGEYVNALTAFNAGKFDDAIRGLHPLAEHASDPGVKLKAEHYLGQALAKRNLPVLATVYEARVVQEGGGHPFHDEAVEALAELQRRLNDPYLIPTLFSQLDAQSWTNLPPETQARVRYLVALARTREGKFEEARSLLEPIAPNSRIYPKARYLLGTVLADPRYPGGAQVDASVGAFRDVLRVRDNDQDDLKTVRQLAQLGIGRVLYGAGRWHESVQAYEAVPRHSRYWDQALFENAFARYRDGDPGGALGSLQALHAPQFESAFQPESWLLKATVYHFACLYAESKAALNAFDQRYTPMANTLRPLLEQTGDDYPAYEALVTDPKQEGRIPRPVLVWVRSNERVGEALGLVSEIDREKAEVQQLNFTGPVAADLQQTLEQNRTVVVQTAGKLVKNRLTEAYQNIRKDTNDGDLIKLETTLAEKRLLEQNVDQKKLLAEQHLYRPASPNEAWNYWQFQGEFWIDEIGYYQYTLKNGCPDQQPQAAK